MRIPSNMSQKEQVPKADTQSTKEAKFMGHYYKIMSLDTQLSKYYNGKNKEGVLTYESFKKICEEFALLKYQALYAPADKVARMKEVGERVRQRMLVAFEEWLQKAAREGKTRTFQFLLDTLKIHLLELAFNSQTQEEDAKRQEEDMQKLVATIAPQLEEGVLDRLVAEISQYKPVEENPLLGRNRDILKQLEVSVESLEKEYAASQTLLGKRDKNIPDYIQALITEVKSPLIRLANAEERALKNFFKKDDSQEPALTSGGNH